MLDRIRTHNALGNHLIQDCCENSMGVVIADDLLVDGMLDSERILIIKPDSFYNTRDFATPPQSIDCIIIVKCRNGSYKFFLVELKDCSGSYGIKPKEIEPKFSTIIDDFFGKDFIDVFSDDTFVVADVKLWLVTNAFRTSELDYDTYVQRIRGTVLEQYQSRKPFKVFGKYVLIEPIVPYRQRTAPMVTAC